MYNLQEKFTFQGFKMIQNSVINRKAVISYIKFLLGGRDDAWRMVPEGQGVREERDYTVLNVDNKGAFLRLKFNFGQEMHVIFEAMSNVLLVKTMWNLCSLQRHLTLKQERTVRAVFRDVYDPRDDSKFPILGVELVKHMSITKYAMRAECRHDVETFVKQANNLVIEEINDSMPDVTAVFESELSIEAIIALMLDMDDSHVMLQTVKPFSEYTGIRG